jgi:glycosyltransferase involved in cell wall biosynthesis
VRVAYVLPFPELNGGNKVIFQHAGLLRRAGHEVTVVAHGPKPGWVEIDAAYLDATAGPVRLPEQDLWIATYWTTLPVARRLSQELGGAALAHFCQGYEGGLAHLRPELAAIEEVYAWPVPALTVSPHLADFLRARFGRESRVVPPPLDPRFRPRRRWRPRRRPWVVVPGIFESEVKGVPVALAAVRRLRAAGVPCRVLRFSILPLTAAERELVEPDLYLCSVPPGEIARAVRGCDLLLLPSRSGEGFGLPLLEAMAAGVPAVASRIPSTIPIGEGAAALVPEGDSPAFAEAARRLLTDSRAWRAARRDGIAAAARYRPEAVAPALDEAVRWARERALAHPLTAGNGGSWVPAL